MKPVIGVIGLGYVGLPLAMAACSRGLRTIGYDVDPKKIGRLKNGTSYIGDVPSGLLRRHVKSGRFRPVSEPGPLSSADAILICVPTPVDRRKRPDLSHLRRTAVLLARILRKGQLISLESTTYPGTTRKILLPILRRSGLKPERDFFLVHSPERVDPGNRRFPFEKIPKVVGGIGPASLRRGVSIYRRIVSRVVPVSSAEVAEASKMLENIYRAVNIALVNEMKIALDRMGVNIWEVIRASSTKPFGFHPFYPGPGWGGHCIPVDPFYFSWAARKAGAPARFIEYAGRVNSEMPRFVVEKLAQAFRQRGRRLRGSKILVLGVAYKPDTDDIRESPALEILEILRRRKCETAYHDPFVPRLHPGREHRFRMRSVPWNRLLPRRFDAAILVTNHRLYRSKKGDRVLREFSLVVDTRNAVPATRTNRIPA